MHSIRLCFLVDTFNPFILKEIITIYVPVDILLIVLDLFF